MRLLGTFPVVKVKLLRPVSLQVLEGVRLGLPPPVIPNGHGAVVDHGQLRRCLLPLYGFKGQADGDANLLLLGGGGGRGVRRALEGGPGLRGCAHAGVPGPFLGLGTERSPGPGASRAWLLSDRGVRPRQRLSLGRHLQKEEKTKWILYLMHSFAP